MKMTSRTIVFFGNERLATGVSTSAPILKSLIAAGYKVAAIISNYHPSDRKLEIQEVAEAHNIPILLPERPSEIASELKKYKADAGVLVAYGKIVPQSVIDTFPYGIINIHPSLLPLHRGPTPIESVILGGEKRTGVSLMQLVAKMDAGPVFARSELALTGSESKQELADSLSDIAEAMLIDRLPAIISGEAVAAPQQDSLAAYDQLITKNDGKIDWTKSAERLEREVRAYSGWPKSHTTLGELEVIITGAHSVPSRPKAAQPGDIDVVEVPGIIMVTTGNGSLCIEKLKPAGKNEMTSVEFIRGYGAKLHS